MSDAGTGGSDGLGSGRKVRSLRELPRELSPARDLWPQLSSQLDQAPLRRGGLRWRLWHVRVAVMVAVAAMASGVTLMVWRPGHHAPTAQPISMHGYAPALAQFSDAEEARRHDEIMRALAARLASLPPGSRQQVLSDLNVIEQSMRDVRTALGRDPGNALLRELLSETYRDEQELLATVQDAGVWARQAGDGKGRT
jgi:hypothetical protein